MVAYLTCKLRTDLVAVLHNDNNAIERAQSAIRSRLHR
jgi:hypothetical protein